MNFFSIILIIIFLSSNLLANKKLKIAISSDFVPYTFINDEGEPDGLFIDYWKLWSKKSGYEIEFVSSSWKNSLLNLKDESIDIHSGLFKNKKRAKYIKFLNKMFKVSSGIYIRKSDSKHIESFEDLNEKTVGVLTNSFYDDYLIKNHSEIKVKRFDTYVELIESLYNKSVDAILDIRDTSYYNIIKSLKFSEISLLDNTAFKNWFFVGINKNKEKLSSIVINGINKITKKELTFLETKWAVKDKLTLHKNSKKDLLSLKEKAYLDNKGITLAVLNNWNNFSFHNKDKEFVGFHLDLIKEIEQVINTKVTIVEFSSWSSAFSSVKKGKIDSIIGLSWSKQREKYFSYTKPYYFNPYNLIVRKNEKEISSLKDVSNKIAVTTKDAITKTTIKNISPNTKIIDAKNREEILNLISSNRADFSLISNISERTLLKRNLKIVKEIYSKEGELTLGVNKDKKIITSILSKAMNAISLEKLDSIKKKWIKKKSTLNSSNLELDYINNSKILKVGVFNNPPMIYLNKEGKIDGLTGELFNEFLKKSGLKFEFVKGTFSSIMSNFKKGEIDLIPSVYFLKSREKFGKYTDSFLSVKDFLYVKESNNSIKTFKDLKGKKLAIINGYTVNSIIKNKFPQIKIVNTRNLSESITKVLNGEVDALYDSQMSVDHLLNKLLINNLKEIHQSSIKANSIHLFIQKDEDTLKDILNKSIYSLSLSKKNKIINKWLRDKNTLKKYKDINMYLGIPIEPYVFSGINLNGIIYDLVEKALSLNNININSVKIANNNVSVNLLEDKYDIDLIAPVFKERDEYFYSDDFVNFNNVIVSRADTNIEINNLSDLKDKRIAAFFMASKSLGEEYKNLIKGKNSSYSESKNHDFLIKQLIDKKVDVLILDKSIFIWYLKKLKYFKLENFKIHEKILQVTKSTVAFKNKELRDIFNINLETLKNSGEYEEIFSNYLKNDISSKSKINSLLATLISRSIYEENHEELNSIIKEFLALKYIDKIEVYSKVSTESIYSKTIRDSNSFLKQKSNYKISDIPLYVGYIKVFYNESLLNDAVKEDKIIPDISLFKVLNIFDYIENVYKEFGYINQKINLSNKEKEYIFNNPIVRYSTMNWEPISIINENKVYGILSDYIKEIELKTGLKFVFNKSKSWRDIQKRFKEDELDVIPKVELLNKDNKKGLLSREMSYFNFSIVTRRDGSFIDDIRLLLNKTVALPKGYPNYNYIKKNFPSLKILEAKDMREALSFVANKKADAFIAFTEVSLFNINKYFPNLKVVGITKDKFIHNFLINKNSPELQSIINKALKTIDYEKKEEIKNKWVKQEVDTAIDYRLVYQLLGIFFVILLVILYFMQKIAKEKIKTLDINKELNNQKKKLETLFHDTNDAIFLIKNGAYIDANSSGLMLFAYKSREEFLSTVAGTISPKYQDNKEKSSDEMKKHIKNCFEQGSVRFQWLCKNLDEKVFWIEIVLTKVNVDNEDIVHMVCRDINEMKVLESEVKSRAHELVLSNEELEDSNEELQTTINNLKQTQDQLVASEKMASLGGLVAGVAHEINTPVGIGLTGITHLEDITHKITSNYEKDEMTQEEFEEYLKDSKELNSLIHANLKKAASLVKSFKQVAVDQSSEEKREFNIYEYTKEILTSLRSVLKKTDVKIKINCDKNIEMFSYPGAYSQIITNLIMNSLLHGFSSKGVGNISLDIFKDNNTINIIYSDDGKGISKENLLKIFDPFFTTNRENGGSGLGLNIIYNIVTSKLNGSIKCKSELGNGVEFIIKLKVSNM